ncbi:MAG: hypothetical protein EPN36_14115 [Rhodanobacteraceae bacterium]|nr:MAG: hypothetical protein EPN36_14115 [Rhodanobacteraceae bacterium]
MRIRTLALAVATAAVASLTGCTAMTQVHNSVESGYSRAAAAARPSLDMIDRTPHKDHGPAVLDVPYVSIVPITHSTGYPPVFDESVDVNFQPSETVGAMLHTVSDMTGVTVTAAPGVLSSLPGVGAAPAAPAHQDSTLDLPPSIIGDASGSAGAEAGAAAPAFAPSLSYNGNLKGLLDAIAAKLDAAWSYDAPTNTVRMFRYETKVFTLATTPGNSTSDAGVGGSNGRTVQGQQGSSTTVAGASANTAYKGDLEVWKTVGAAVKTMLSKDGNVTLSEATGTLVVRDRFDRVDQVAQYIKQVNARLQLGVQVNVTIYRVSVNDGDNRGIDWGVMYNALGRLANDVGATIATTPIPISGSTSMVFNAPKYANKAGTVANLFAGSNLMVQALSTLGHATVETHQVIFTTNNQPSTIKNVNDQSYLAEATSMYTNGVSGGQQGVVGAGATLTPGSVETGLTMQVLPSVQADGQHVLLQLTLSDSTLESLNTISSGGNEIQVPDVSARQTIQRAWLRSGQTLVLAGFDESHNQNTTKTPFGEHTWLFGGNRALTHSRDAIVIVVTPVVTNAALDGGTASIAAPLSPAWRWRIADAAMFAPRLAYADSRTQLLVQE